MVRIKLRMWVLLGCVLVVSPESFARESCADLSRLSVAHSRVLEVIDLSGSMTVGNQLGGFSAVEGPTRLVRGQIKPTTASDIRFEVWLPDPTHWNGHFQAVGNGGNAGTIIYSAMRDAFNAGFVAAATDTGHIGSMFDSSYAIGQPDRVTNFGWRSLAELPPIVHQLITNFYEREADVSIFNGCSTGGRQALQLAQRFPALYDSIIAGAPANYWPELNAMHADYGQFLLSDKRHWVSRSKLAMVEAAVHESCGAVDGIIDDPEACHFDITSLQCRDGEVANCLKSEQILSLGRRYRDLVDPNGDLIYPGYTQGAETELTFGGMGESPQDRFNSSWTWRFPEGFFRDYVHQDPAWTVRQFDLLRDLETAQQGLIGKSVFAHDRNLAEFKKAGGKLLIWHGWHDMSIAAAN